MPSFTPPNPDYRAFIENREAAQGYLRLLGTQLARVEPGIIEIRVLRRPELVQHAGVFHGGVIGGIAEAVMGTAAATMVPSGSDIVGAEYKVNFVAPGSGDFLLARGHVVWPGRKLIVCRADILSVDREGAETLCAVAQGTMAVVKGAASRA